MEELWTPPGDAAAGAIRTVCERVLSEAEEVNEAIFAPSLTAHGDPALLADAALISEYVELNRSDVVQWLTSNIQRPGLRVEPFVSQRAVAYIGDLVSRGIAPEFAAGWRGALSVVWPLWVERCFEYIPDRATLIDVLSVSAYSIAQYALDSVSMLREVSLAAAMGNAGAEAIATIQLIAGGAPMTPDLAEQRLSYRLGREHVALVLWTDDPAHGEALDDVVSALRAGRPARTLLVARASAASRWLWLSGPQSPDLPHLAKTVSDFMHCRAAVGRPGYGLDGFRSSHQDALAAHALLTRVGSARRFTAYADVELADSLTKDREGALRFVEKTLGPLAEADAELQQALLTYVQCGFNATRAAARLYLHRNTVERRVTRADELSTVKIEDNPTNVAAALLVLDLLQEA